MSTFVYMTRCDGCGHCVDICPSDIMHIDENIRRAKNIEPNFCWECYSCVKACPNHAIDVRGYADFAPMGHSVRVRREEEKGTISWKIKFRNGTTKDFVSPITTKPWGKFIPKLAEGDKPNQGEINSQRLYTEPEGLNIDGELEGTVVGTALGTTVGIKDGVVVGMHVGTLDGTIEGTALGTVEGNEEGSVDGNLVGTQVG